MSVLSDITSVIGLATKAKELADKLKNLELKEVIVDLQGKLLDLKGELIELREENARLTEELKRASAPPEVTLKDGLYYKNDDGPFCTSCYDSNRKMIRLIDGTRDEQMVMGVRRKCPACGAIYPK
jgi:hypothetical protein